MKLTARVCLALACYLIAIAGGEAKAATSIADPLTSFNAGLYSVSAADPIVYDAGGAHFGTGIPGDGGRSYQRTIDGDYATLGFVAEITFSVTSNDQAVFFGLGTGDTALFGTPDWSTQFSSASFWPELANDKFVRFRTANDVNAFADTTVTGGLDPGTHRMRMTLNPANNQLLGEIDVNYAGGPFVADSVGSNFPIVVSSLFAADGWPSEPSRIFVGGDDGATFRDFSVQVVPEPAGAVLAVIALAGLAGRRRQASNCNKNESRVATRV
jgi:MYXO-CTERM domain-containing protein